MRRSLWIHNVTRGGMRRASVVPAWPHGVGAVARSLFIQFVRVAGIVFVMGGTAGCVQYRGAVSAEGRVFLQSPQYPGQASGNGGSVVTEPEFYVQSESGEHTTTLRPFARIDSADPKRTHYDIRQADYRFTNEHWTLGAGVGLFSWGVLENHRPVDVLNQKDLVEDVEGRAKLGQPYAQVGWNRGAWSLDLYYLPYFRDRTFPGVRGRIRFPAVVDTSQPLFESSLRRVHPNVAARLGVSAGEFDLGFSGFSGTSREPRFFAQLTDATVVPRYELLEQVSFDGQWTHGGVVAKAETVARWWSSRFDFSVAAAGGLEYWFFDIGGSGVDLTLVTEYYFDNRAPGSPLTFYQNDIFGGLRLAFNNIGDTQVLAGGMVDLRSGSSFLRFETAHRFGEHWKLALELRGFLARSDVLESAVARDNFAQLRVSYHF